VRLPAPGIPGIPGTPGTPGVERGGFFFRGRGFRGFRGRNPRKPRLSRPERLKCRCIPPELPQKLPNHPAFLEVAEVSRPTYIVVAIIAAVAAFAGLYFIGGGKLEHAYRIERKLDPATYEPWIERVTLVISLTGAAVVVLAFVLIDRLRRSRTRPPLLEAGDGWRGGVSDPRKPGSWDSSV
jgi:hypothetical protein